MGVLGTYILVQGVVSVVLLVVAMILHHDDPSTSSTIIGAVIGLWLRESVHLGQQVHEKVRANGADQ